MKASWFVKHAKKFDKVWDQKYGNGIITGFSETRDLALLVNFTGTVLWIHKDSKGLDKGHRGFK